VYLCALPGHAHAPNWHSADYDDEDDELDELEDEESVEEHEETIEQLEEDDAGLTLLQGVIFGCSATPCLKTTLV